MENYLAIVNALCSSTGAEDVLVGHDGRVVAMVYPVGSPVLQNPAFKVSEYYYGSALVTGNPTYKAGRRMNDKIAATNERLAQL